MESAWAGVAGTDGDEYGEALVSVGGAKGALWKSYAAEDLGILAIQAAYADSVVDGGGWP